MGLARRGRAEIPQPMEHRLAIASKVKGWFDQEGVLKTVIGE